MTRIVAEPGVIKAIAAWQDWLRHERRAAENTIVSYELDLKGFFLFLSDHLGYPPGLGDLVALTTMDFRGYLAGRNANGLARTSTARAVSTLKGFFRFLERREFAENEAIHALRSQKIPKSVPKALTAEDAMEALNESRFPIAKGWRERQLSQPILRIRILDINGADQFACRDVSRQIKWEFAKNQLQGAKSLRLEINGKFKGNHATRVFVDGESLTDLIIKFRC